MSRIAIIGAGAIGGVVCAQLSAHDVTLCTRTPLDALYIETASEVLRPKFRNVIDPRSVPRVDFILLCTKAHQTASAQQWLAALCHPGAVLAVLQNGVEHIERLLPFAGTTPILPVVVKFPATRTHADRIALRGPVQLFVPATDHGAAFAALFAGSAAQVTCRADFTTELWRKLCSNLPAAILALTAQPTAVLRRADLQTLGRALILEALHVARAEGAVLDDSLADTIIEGLCLGPGDATSSILEDVRARRPLEYEARNGVVVKVGARHGIETPLNAAVTALLAGLSAGFEG